MMTANELRIGNYIIEKGFGSGEPKQVSALDIYNIVKHKGDIKGVPLTEEWLVKMGFVDSGEGYYKHPNENFHLYNNVDARYFECYKEVPANDFTGDYKTIRYVHKLQNLFFELYDEELTIKDL